MSRFRDVRRLSYAKPRLPDFEIVPYNENIFDGYAAFANRAWGEGCHQASRNYLEWLYRANPSANRGFADCLVARVGETIVGCIHKMRVVWNSGSEFAEVPALCDWMVEEEYRKGLGLVLLEKVMRAEDHAFHSSAVGPHASIYRRLGCQEIPCCWYRQVLLTVCGTVRYAVDRLGGVLGSPDINEKLVALADPRQFAAVRITMGPTEPECNLMIEALADQEAKSWRPRWTLETFQWRFFHAQGPRHVCVYSSEPSAVGEFLIVSVGMRKGLLVARLVEVCVQTAAGARRLLAYTRRALRHCGIHVLLAYSADPKTNACLQAAGWAPRTDENRSFIFHRSGQPAFAAVAINGSAADYGLEAMAL